MTTRIVYDHQIFLRLRYGGISRYFAELAAGIGSADGFKATILAPLYVSELLNRKCHNIRGWKTKPRRYMYPAMDLVDTCISSATCWLSPPDVVHETYYSSHTIAPSHVPIVVTVYDMIHERFQSQPGREEFSAKKRLAVARAALVICISEHTREDLIDILGVRPEKTVTVYLGVHRPDGGPTTQLENPVGKPFLLYVGERAGYKNFDGLLAAYARSKRLRDYCGIVALGGSPFGRPELDRIVQLGLTWNQHVIHLHGGDRRLEELYRSALALVYPSLYEGFGLPPLEAMAHGCPVVCSDAASLPEVVGNAGLFFDPANTEQLRQAIEQVVDSSDLRATLITKGLKRVEQFSWSRCIEQTAGLYRRVTRSNRVHC